MTRAEFKDALKGNVDISPDDFKLMLKIVDPKDHSLNDKKHKIEFSKLIEFGERAKNSMKQQVSQIVLLNCISEQVTAFLKYDLAF